MRHRQSIVCLAGGVAVVLSSAAGCGTLPANSVVAPATIEALPHRIAALPSTPVGVAMGQDNRGITVGSNGYSNDTSVWVTDTGGRQWTEVLSVNNLLTTAYWASRSLQSIWIAGVADRPKPHDPQWLQPILWHSVNGGITWTRVLATVPRQAGFRTEGIDWTQLVWSAARFGWAMTTDGRVLRTADGGKQWELVSAFGRHRIRQIQFVNREDGWVLSASSESGSSFVWITTDGGRTWHRQQLPGHIDSLDFVSPSRGWAAGGVPAPGRRWTRVIWSTTDGARHWSRHELGTVAFVDQVMAGVTAASARVLWATSDGSVNSPPPWMVNQPLAGHLWISQNGGQTWHELRIPATVGAVSLPQFADPTHGWFPALAARGTQLPSEYLYRWQALGKRWVPVPGT